MYSYIFGLVLKTLMLAFSQMLFKCDLAILRDNNLLRNLT